MGLIESSGITAITEKHADEIADILDGAADYIEKNGWVQDDLYGSPSRSDKRSACSLGAIEAWCEMQYGWDRPVIEVSSRVIPMTTAAVRQCWADKILHDYLGLSVNNSVPWWNDQFTRTEQEVLDAMRGCAKQLRKEAEEIT